MELIADILLGILGFFLARWALGQVGLDEAVGLIISLFVGILVFSQRWGAEILSRS